MDKNPDRFCVYVLLDPRKYGIFIYGEYKFEYEPFYVGKGFLTRPKAHFEPRLLKEKTRKSSKIKAVIKTTGQNPPYLILKTGITDQEACRSEVLLIKQIGRLDCKTGPLVNGTDGGTGGVKIPSKETRIKLSKALKGRKWTSAEYEAHKNGKKMRSPGPQSKEVREKKSLKLRGQKRPIEVIEKIRESRRRFIAEHGAPCGWKHTEETKEKMRKAALDRPKHRRLENASI